MTEATSGEGLALLQAEMARQGGDAIASLTANKAIAAELAASIMRTGQLVLIGMGASHYANRMAETSWRRLGVDCRAETAGDVLLQGLPMQPRTIVLVSQSGESGEILQLLERLPRGADLFGMTLAPQSTLGRTLACLVGTGGQEVAFAATRSLTITLALHAAVLAAAGGDNNDLGDILVAPAQPALDEALEALAPKNSVIVAGRGELRGLAEANGLMLMELGRIPAFGFEFGQFRHGPLEALAPDLGVLLLRGPGTLGAGTVTLARAAFSAGTVPVIFDCSGELPIEDVLTVAFPRSEGLSAVVAMLPALQKLIIAVADRKVVGVGEPVRSTKVTGIDHEA
ncbi:aminotransferase [Mesorhizobium loti]|nr:aminotransferase [Mesorhizobium loti]PLP57938.1 aminotransferase [Mesorhizobium loti]